MGIRATMLRGAVALAVAVATGHLVQLIRPQPSSAGLGSSDTALPAAAAPAATVPETASLRSGLALDEPRLVGITSVAAALDPADSCPATLRLTPGPDAMIDLALDAPCNKAERIVIRHAGLSFTAKTDASGAARLTLPALQPDAVVAVYLTGSAIALANVEVPEAGQLRRVAFQWKSPVSFSLRVTEGERVFVGDGIVRGHDRIVSLGSLAVQDPSLAQVYTYPAGPADEVDMALELRVGPETCGRTFTAQKLVADWGFVQLVDIPVSVPLCGTAGDILVLKNLAPDLTLATPK